jgi:hypothetical protein
MGLEFEPNMFFGFPKCVKLFEEVRAVLLLLVAY